MSDRPIRLLAAALAGAILAASPAAAQLGGDRGKDRIAKLFRQAANEAADATVRVQCDAKDAALGTIVSPDGYILTKGSEFLKGNELRGEIACKLSDGTAYDAKCVGYHRDTDLALLKIDHTGLKAAKFADPTALAVGNWVAAPGPGADVVLAVGVVSAAARKLIRPDEKVIENANKGYLGIRLDEPVDGSGVLVARVEPNAAAAKAGLKKDDLIREVAGNAVSSPMKLIELLDAYRPGDTVTVRVKRGEEELSLKVRLGTRADFSRGDFQNGMGGSLSGRRTGFPAVIQHDTVVRPADCGGPLVDLDGNVLGINIARAGRVETWALPPDLIAKTLTDLKAGKYPVATK